MPQLAEFNWGILKHDWGDPRVADFADNVDRVNALAQRSQGFVWRLSDQEMDAAQNDPHGPLGGNPRMASTLSVWQDGASLHRFVWKTLHVRFLKRGGEWFEETTRPRMVLWHVSDGVRPSLAEAMDRLRHLEHHGASAAAFDWAWARNQGLLGVGDIE